MLYLDGLNEMGKTGIEKAKKLNEWFSSNQSPKKVIVTCREDDYKGNLKFSNLPTVLVEQMSDVQIAAFAQHYLEDQAEEFLTLITPRREIPEWERENQSVRSLYNLAHNPYLLAALIFLFKNSPAHDLPKNNGTLMNALTNILWRREQDRQTSGWIAYEEMEEKFGNLAFDMISYDMSVDIPVKYALQYVGSSNLLKAAHNANIIEMHGENIRFYHQLMQEYFAATKLKDIQLDQSFITQQIGMYGSRSGGKWDEVIIALCGIANQYQINQVFEIVGFSDVYLAAQCVASGVEIDYELRRKIFSKHLVLENTSFALLGDTFKLLAYSRQDYAISMILKFLGHHNAFRILSATSEALEIYGSLAVPELLDALQNPNSMIRVRAVSVLGDIGDKSTVPHIIERLYDEGGDGWGRGYYTCVAAAIALKKIGTDEANHAVQGRLNEWLLDLDKNRKNVSKITLRGIEAILQASDKPEKVRILEKINTDTILDLIELVVFESNQEFSTVHWDLAPFFAVLDNPAIIGILSRYYDTSSNAKKTIYSIGIDNLANTLEKWIQREQFLG